MAAGAMARGALMQCGQARRAGARALGAVLAGHPELPRPAPGGGAPRAQSDDACLRTMIQIFSPGQFRNAWPALVVFHLLSSHFAKRGASRHIIEQTLLQCRLATCLRTAAPCMRASDSRCTCSPAAKCVCPSHRCARVAKGSSSFRAGLSLVTRRPLGYQQSCMNHDRNPVPTINIHQHP